MRGQVADLLDEWESIASRKDEGKLQYQPWEVTGALPLLYTRLEPKPSPSYKFVADRSLRDVEPSVNLWLRWPDHEEGDEE